MLPQTEIAATPARIPYAWRIQRFHLVSGKCEGDMVEYSPPDLNIIGNLRRSWRVVVIKMFTDDQFEDLLEVTRTLVVAADRLRQPNSENYPSPVAEGSPLLAAARAACVNHGFTEGGLAIAAAGGAL